MPLQPTQKGCRGARRLIKANRESKKKNEEISYTTWSTRIFNIWCKYRRKKISNPIEKLEERDLGEELDWVHKEGPEARRY